MRTCPSQPNACPLCMRTKPQAKCNTKQAKNPSPGREQHLPGSPRHDRQRARRWVPDPHRTKPRGCLQKSHATITSHSRAEVLEVPGDGATSRPMLRIWRLISELGEPPGVCPHQEQWLPPLPSQFQYQTISMALQGQREAGVHTWGKPCPQLEIRGVPDSQAASRSHKNCCCGEQQGCSAPPGLPPSFTRSCPAEHPSSVSCATAPRHFGCGEGRASPGHFLQHLTSTGRRC